MKESYTVDYGDKHTMYREVCDTCGNIIPRGPNNPMITVEKLVMTKYKAETTLHFCNRDCFLTFMESRV